MRILIEPARILMICAAMFFLNSCNDEDHLGNVDDVVVEELERLSVDTTADAEISEVQLPDDLDATANWGLKAIVCEEGGYDLYPFAGKTVTLTMVDIKGTCQDEKIRIWVVSEEDIIAGAYITTREGSSMVPGVWSVNSGNCEY